MLTRTALPRTVPTGERKVRTKRCASKGCRAEFVPRTPLQKVCCPPCAIDFAMAERARKERKERQEGLRKLKTRQKWLSEAQAAFNSFIRQRDHDQPCISCGRFHTGSYDAGHYRSVGAQPALRFDETNVHKQCVHCNQHKSGNVVEYRIRLVQKIGAAAVELLEVEHEPARYTIEDAQRIKETYKAKLKALLGGCKPIPRTNFEIVTDWRDLADFPEEQRVTNSRASA